MTGHQRCREQGVSDEKILALERYATSPLYDEKERVALEYADAITLSERDVDDELFERVRLSFDEDAVVELTVVIAASSTGLCACPLKDSGSERTDNQ